MIITRGDIEDSIRSILDRSDLDGDITKWFRRAHHHVQQKHNFLAMQLTAFTGVALDQTRFEVPDGFKNDIALYTYNPFDGTSIRFFEKADIEFMREQRKTRVLHETSMFALWSNVFEIDPPISESEVPNQMRLDYYGYLEVPALDGDDYFTTNGESYLIYRSLRESAPFLGADSRLKIWLDLETDAWKDLYRVDMEARIAGSLVMRG